MTHPRLMSAASGVHHFFCSLPTIPTPAAAAPPVCVASGHVPAAVRHTLQYVHRHTSSSAAGTSDDKPLAALNCERYDGIFVYFAGAAGLV
jgi:hypothetical protein